MTVWLIRAGRGGLHLPEFLRRGIVTVGWERTGSVEGHDRAVIRGIVESEYGPRGAPSAAGTLFRFANDVEEGDVVLSPDPRRREIHPGVIAGPYEFRSPPPVEGHPHLRAVRWSEPFGRDELSARAKQELTAMTTLSRPSSQKELDRLARVGTTT